MEVPADDNSSPLTSQQFRDANEKSQQAASTPAAVEEEEKQPAQEPPMNGDIQGAEVTAYLRKRITEEQFDAYCIDCQNNRSSHCNITFGTFICAECAEKHTQTYSQFQSYIKPLFADAWDNFQIACI